MQGAPCGTRSWDSRITPVRKADAQPMSHPGIPPLKFFLLLPLLLVNQDGPSTQTPLAFRARQFLVTWNCPIYNSWFTIPVLYPLNANNDTEALRQK